MATAKIPVRIKGQTTCEHHKGKQLELYCEKCEEPVCSKCVTSLHKGHLFCDLSEITPQKKKKIRNFIDKTEKNALQDIGKYIASANTLLTENDSTFEKLSKDLKTQTERLKQDLDKLTAETLLVYQEMKNDNIKLIQKYKQDLEIYEKQLKHQMQECKKTLQQASPIEIFETECEVDSRLHLPVTPVLRTANFTPNRNPRYHLELALGTSDDSGQALGVKDQSVSLSDAQGQSSTQQSGGTRTKAVTRTKLLMKAKVLEEWESSCDINSICLTANDQIWTASNEDNKTLILLDVKGNVIQEIKHKSEINDASLRPITHRLWACESDNSILELKSKQFSERFRTKNESRSICVTSDNHIIIGMPKYITKYTTQGQMVLSTEAVGTGKPLVYSPWVITECTITKNVAVIDHSDKCDGGDGDKHVVVMDTDFQELFMYRSAIPSGRRHGKTFDPLGIVYDNLGNIIIADCDNDKIHILHGDGEVLRILDTEVNRVHSVGVSRQGVLWTVNCYNNVKLLQYYE